MPPPTEQKAVQSRILAYAQDACAWMCVSQAAAERLRGFDSDAATADDRAH
jgi:hypothetical protein